MMLRHALIFIRGMMMGAADIVPGVSGGTIAFITGIYERLINAISQFSKHGWSFLTHRNVKRFFVEADLLFLITLLAGILFSIALFASLITYALDVYPVQVWSFFSGLIISSLYVIGRQVTRWDFQKFVSIGIGIGFAFLITHSGFAQLPHNLIGAFLSGFIAICAMILPGISGSFLLLLLGTYTFVLGAIQDINVAVLATFALGCVSGLLLVSQLISFLLRRFHDVMLSFLLGIIIGSMNMVWPWRHTISYRINSSGVEVPFQQATVWPSDYVALTGESAFLLPASICFIAGLALIVGMTRFVANLERN